MQGHSNIGAVYDSPGEKQKALDFFTQKPPPSRAFGNRSGEATTLGNIAYVKRALGHFDETSSHMECVLKIIESLGAKVISHELPASYFATAHGYYVFSVDMLMEVCEKAIAKGHHATALPAGERRRPLADREFNRSSRRHSERY